LRKEEEMSTTSNTWQYYRKQFPKLASSDSIYLDSAATTHKPASVIEAMSAFYQKHYATVHRAVYRDAAFATDMYVKARELVAHFLSADSSEIVFTRGATSAINLVASSFGKAFVNPQDEILITEMEHHSNIVPWQMMAKERGANLKVIPFTDQGELDLEVFASQLTEKTKIVACCHISNTLGTENAIHKIIELSHQKGAKVLIDGAQSVAHTKIDVKKLDADFFVFSGHKIYGPTGIGVLYGKKELLDKMPPIEGGGDMIEEVRFEKTTYAPSPLKFEAGTPMIAEVLGLAEALRFISQIGLEKIAHYEEELMDGLLNKLLSIPDLHLLGSLRKKKSLVSFWVEGVHALDVASLMDAKGVAMRSGHLCAQPVMRHFAIPSALRFSLAFYNTHQEIEEAVLRLRKTLEILR
jgi:cysteine desulfurase / selenocysteine lyase